MNRTQTSLVSVGDARFAVEAARWAPSVHNTQPWRFGVHSAGEGGRITLRADADRRLEVADPDGREMPISGGTALYTLRAAILRLGYVPRVRLLPDPDRPHLLAEVEFGDEPAEPGRAAEAERLYGQIGARRTHRGSSGPGRCR
jgi:nitroreductase